MTAQLVNSADGYHLWSDRYDRELKDIFAVQDEIAQAVVSALRQKLVGAPAGQLVTRATENPEAYDLYLKGRVTGIAGVPTPWPRRPISSNARSPRTPHTPPRGPALPMHLALLCHWTVAPREMWGKAKRAALKALELDPDLPEGHSALGLILSFHEWDWQGAERALRRAIELNPARRRPHLYGAHLTALGSLDESRVHYQQAAAIDPLAIFSNGPSLAVTYYYLRDYERAIRELEMTPISIRLTRKRICIWSVVSCSAQARRGSEGARTWHGITRRRHPHARHPRVRLCDHGQARRRTPAP